MNPIPYILIGAALAWVLSGALDIIIYAAGFAAIIGGATWLYANAEEIFRDEVDK